jgi:hypothetical protein
VPQPWLPAETDHALRVVLARPDGSAFPANFDTVACAYGSVSTGSFVPQGTWSVDKTQSDNYAFGGKKSAKLFITTTDITTQAWYTADPGSFRIRLTITDVRGGQMTSTLPVTAVDCDPCG